jgi:hypothetical protein
MHAEKRSPLDRRFLNNQSLSLARTGLAEPAQPHSTLPPLRLMLPVTTALL